MPDPAATSDKFLKSGYNSTSRVPNIFTGGRKLDLGQKLSIPAKSEVINSPSAASTNYQQILQNQTKFQQAGRNTGYLSQRSLSNTQNKSFADSVGLSKNPEHNYVSEVLKFDSINKQKNPGRLNISSGMPQKGLR